MSRYVTFIYWLFNKDKKPIYLDGNTVATGDPNTLLKSSGLPAKLDHAPTGWKETMVKYARNTKYMGLFRDYSVPVTFAIDGAKIIRDAIFRHGFNSEMFFAISKIDRAGTYPMTYRDWYFGEVDLSKFKRDKDTVTVSITEGGVSKYLKAYENTQYEINVASDVEAKTIYLDGFPFKSKIEYTFYEQSVNRAGVDRDFTMGMGVIVNEGTSQGVIYQDQTFAQTNSLPNQDFFFQTVTKTLRLTVTGKIRIYMLQSVRLYLYFEKVNGTTSTGYLIHNTTPAAGSIVEIDIAEVFDLVPGDTLYVKCNVQGATPPIAVWAVVQGSNLLLDYKVTFDPTFCKAITAKRLFELLTDKITGGRFLCSSSFLDSLSDSIVFTSGQALRNFENDNAVIKMSMEDFFKSVRRWGVGLGIENDRLVIESINYFFENDIAMNLGEVNNLTVDVAEDLVYNTIKVGYRNNTYDKENGLDEFNVTQQWQTPITKVVKELDLISPARADMTGIEITRLAMYWKDTTDNQSDNDTFMLNVVKGGNFKYYKGAFIVVDSDSIIINNVLEPYLPGSTLILSNGTGIDGTYTTVGTFYSVPGQTRITIVGGLANGSYDGTIEFVSTDLYQLYRPNYTAITGVLFPDEAFNTELSPKKALLSNGAMIHSFLEDDSEMVKFTTGEKNSELSTTLAGVTVTEKEDISIGSLPAKLYKPYYFDFDCEVPSDFLSVMRSNPYGKIQFTWRGITLYGYLWDGGVKPATNDQGKFKLLCSADSDLTKLI